MYNIQCVLLLKSLPTLFSFFFIRVQAPTTMSPASTTPNPDTINLDVPFLDPDEQPTSGIVTEQNTANPNFGADLWKLNVVLALISCWVAMTLTGWGTIEEMEGGSNAANPQVGRWNMAMIGISQVRCHFEMTSVCFLF